MSTYAAWLFCHENMDAYEYLLDYGKYLMPASSLANTIDKVAWLSRKVVD